jgi:hypothetical protein
MHASPTLAVTCPTCSAEAHADCIDAEGHELAEHGSHDARLEAWRARNAELARIDE